MESFSWSGIEAVLFDLDGVLTPTAMMHEQAWSKLFEAYSYTQDDYLKYIDGKPRYEGVESFLKSRNVSLPFGDLGEAPGDNSIAALGNKKNRLFLELLESDGIAPYQGSVDLCDFLQRQGIEVAVVSSSRNAEQVLAAASLRSRFEIVVDGLVAAAEGLPGKPKPDTFLHGAKLVGVPADKAVVIEDATAGVKAAKAGDFKIVVGVDRGAGESELRLSGADVVVKDLKDLVIGG